MLQYLLETELLSNSFNSWFFWLGEWWDG
jgi:hypothetical protein